MLGLSKSVIGSRKPMNSYEELPVEIQRRFQQCAKLTGQDTQSLLIKAIEEGLANIERISTDDNLCPTLYDSLCRRGLIGCIDGGPSDLSTNPKYMEGFGESDRTDSH
jgi:hypothetical protein